MGANLIATGDIKIDAGNDSNDIGLSLSSLSSIKADATGDGALTSDHEPTINIQIKRNGD
jgi:hypothetical protein